jgi:hypothetical protein
MKMFKRKSKGSVLLLVLIFSLIFMMLALISLKLIVAQSSSDELEVLKSRLFYAADSSIERSLSEFIRLNNYKSGANFYELPLAGSPPEATSPWDAIKDSTSFTYSAGLPPTSVTVTRYFFYIETHPANPNIATVDAGKWMIYDNETNPPIKTHSVLREETYPNPAIVGGDPWSWNINDTNDASSIPSNVNSSTSVVAGITYTRRYYVITSQASLYNPSTNALYGDRYISEVHILVEREGTNPSLYRYNYVFRSRKNR